MKGDRRLAVIYGNLKEPLAPEQEATLLRIANGTTWPTALDGIALRTLDSLGLTSRSSILDDDNPAPVWVTLSIQGLRYCAAVELAEARIA